MLLAPIPLGYTVGPERLRETWGRAQRHTGQLVSATLQNALSEFMDEGAYAAHIRRMTRIYRARRDRMMQALTAETLDTFVIDPPAGNAAPGALSAAAGRSKSMRRLAEAGVTARPLSSHFIGRATQQGLFRFCRLTDEEITPVGGSIVARAGR